MHVPSNHCRSRLLIYSLAAAYLAGTPSAFSDPVEDPTPGYRGPGAGLSSAGMAYGSDATGDGWSGNGAAPGAVLTDKSPSKVVKGQIVKGGDGVDDTDSRDGADGTTSPTSPRGEDAQRVPTIAIKSGAAAIEHSLETSGVKLTKEEVSSDTSYTIDLTNNGEIRGGDGGKGGNGGDGGDGATANTDYANAGGGNGSAGAYGGDGGVAMWSTRYRVTNNGVASGGAGGSGGDGGNGGDGGSIGDPVDYLSLRGGNGGAAGQGGVGGTAYAGEEFIVINHGLVTGGTGGAGGATGDGGNGGNSGSSQNSTADGGDAGSNSRSGDMYALDRMAEDKPLLFPTIVQTGGSGGDAIQGYKAEVYNTGTISGGIGGAAGELGSGGLAGSGQSESFNGADSGPTYGGMGGIAISGSSNLIENSGSILGGAGGAGSTAEFDGFGGIAITGDNLEVINRGTISGGMGRDGRNWAIYFTRGESFLQIENGSRINGLVGGSGSEALIFGGPQDQTFNASKIADIRFEKTPVYGDFRGGPDIAVAREMEEGPLEKIELLPEIEPPAENQYFGFEVISVDTDGTVTFTNKATYTQDTIVQRGALNAAGDLSSTDISVRKAGTLMGTGSTGSLLIEGGRHAPGNSIGTQRVNGDYQFDDGTLEIEVTPGVSSDKIVVNGEVTIKKGTLQVLGVNETNSAATANHIIIANDGTDKISGKFSTLDNRLAFYDVEALYNSGDGNDLSLELTRNSVNPEDIVQTATQRAAAGLVFGSNFNQLDNGDGEVIQNAIMGGSVAQARKAFEQLSGDVYAAGPNTQRIVQNGISSPLTGRSAGRGSGGGGSGASLASLFTGREVQVGAFVSDEPIERTGSEVWLEGLGGRGTVDGTFAAAETEYEWRGIITGYEIANTEALTFGLYFSFADVDLDQADRSASIKSENYAAGIYGGYRFGNDMRISMQLGSAWIDNSARRQLQFGAVNRVAQADYTDNHLTASVELAKTINRGETGFIEPFVGVTGRREREGGFLETGAGAANLFRNSDSDYLGEAVLGMRFGFEIETDHSFRIQPRAQLAWQRHLGDTDNTHATNFVGLPLAGAVPVSGTGTAENSFIGTVGVNFLSESGASLYGDYGFGVSDVHSEHSFRGGVSLPW